MQLDTWSTGRLLSTAARLHERSENERLHGHGLTGAGLTLLRVLEMQLSISQAQLATLLHIQPQTVGKTVERLEFRGLVHRERDQDDRRLALVRLTATGRNLLKTIDAEENEFDEALGLTDQDLRAALEMIVISLRPAGRASQRGTRLVGPQSLPLVALAR